MRRWGFLSLILAGLIMGACTPLTTNYRQEGFRFSQMAFDYFEETPDLYRVVELQNVKVHIVGSHCLFKWDKAAARGSGTVGYATSGNEIFVIGKKVGDKLIINQAVLGHELNHLLNFNNQEIADPDQLRLLEYRHYSESVPIPFRKDGRFHLWSSPPERKKPVSDAGSSSVNENRGSCRDD